MRDLFDLSRQHALPLLASLVDEHPEAVNMAIFVRACRLTPERARELRLALEDAGLIRVTFGTERGVTKTTFVNLTPKGLQIGRLAPQIQGILREK